jgi:hypothetical protein
MGDARNRAALPASYDNLIAREPVNARIHSTGR